MGGVSSADVRVAEPCSRVLVKNRILQRGPPRIRYRADGGSAHASMGQDLVSYPWDPRRIGCATTGSETTIAARPTGPPAHRPTGAPGARLVRLPADTGRRSTLPRSSALDDWTGRRMGAAKHGCGHDT